MSVRVAINGCGRIGRNVLRAWVERADPAMSIVALNDVGDADEVLYLLQYDSTHGRFSRPLALSDNKRELVVGEHRIALRSESDPAAIDWKSLGVDVVLECTGMFRRRDQLQPHIDAGARRVLLAAPADDEVDATVVYGINHQVEDSDSLISMASCTTNALAVVLQALVSASVVPSIENVMVTELHGFTRDHELLDAVHRDRRRGRGATQSMIPTETVGIDYVTKIFPEFKDRISGYSMRVPVPNMAAIDLTLRLSSPMSADDVNQAIQQRLDEDTVLAEVLSVCDEPLVSCDFNHHPASAIIDLTQTRVVGNSVKMLAWYDNEWAYANRLLDTVGALWGSE